MIVANGFIPFTCKLNTERYNEIAYLISDDYNAKSFKLHDELVCDDQFFMFYVDEGAEKKEIGGTRMNVHIDFDKETGRVWEGPYIMLCSILGADCDEAKKLYHAIRNKEHLDLKVDMLEVLKPTEDDLKYLAEQDVRKYYGVYTVTVDPLWK